MNTSAVKPGMSLINEVWFVEDMLHVRLLDGREVSVPVEWFPLLSKAKDKERNNWRLIGNGIGIHWEDPDEDISLAGLLMI
ncbi:MAG: DUF2442 domain-containing protein [Candidatus Eremiobacterota bacterium]